MTSGRVYNNRHAGWNGCPTNAGDKGGLLRSHRPDPNLGRLTRHTNVANVDVVAASEVYTGIKAQCDVAPAGIVEFERSDTVGRVVAAGCVGQERSGTGGRVAAAGCVVN